MIDFHTHVLYGIDDGAKTFEESAQLLETLKLQGVDEIVFTPHYDVNEQSYGEFIALYDEHYNVLKNAFSKDFKFYRGYELYFDGSKIFRYSKYYKFAVADSRYILIEFPFGIKLRSEFIKCLSRFIDRTGLIPVIAHLERFQSLVNHPQNINELIDMGCLMQISTEAFLVDATKEFAFCVLRERAVQCLGSDAHNMQNRKPRYGECINAIEGRLGKEYVEYLQDNMRRILDNEFVEAKPNKTLRRFFGKYI